MEKASRIVLFYLLNLHQALVNFCTCNQPKKNNYSNVFFLEQKIKGCGNEKLSEQFSTSDICYITNRDLSEDSVCYKCRHDLCNDIDTTPSPNPVLRKCMEQVCNDDDDCEPQKSRTCDLGVSACISLRNKAGVIKKSCYATPLVNNQKVYTQLPTVKECDDLHQYYKKDNSVFCDICYSDNCNFDTTALREAEIRDKEEIKKPSRKCYSCIGKDCDKNKYIRDVCHKNTSECYTIKGMGKIIIVHYIFESEAKVMKKNSRYPRKGVQFTSE